MACKGVFELQFIFKGKPISGLFVVSPSLSGPPILGMNVMAKYGLTLDPITGEISLPSQVQPLEQTDSKERWQVAVAESVKMLPFTGTKVKCRLVDDSFKLTKPRQFLAEIHGLCSAINSSEAGCFWMFVPNASKDDICLERGEIIR